MLFQYLSPFLFLSVINVVSAMEEAPTNHQLAPIQIQKASPLQPPEAKFQKRWAKVAALAKARRSETEVLLKLYDEPGPTGQPATLQEICLRFCTPESAQKSRLQESVRTYRTRLEADIVSFEKFSQLTLQPFTKELDDALMEFYMEIKTYQRNIKYYQSERDKSEQLPDKLWNPYMEDIIESDQAFYMRSLQKLTPYQYGSFYIESSMLTTTQFGFGVDVTAVLTNLQARTQKNCERLALLKKEFDLNETACSKIRDDLQEKMDEVIKSLSPYTYSNIIIAPISKSGKKRDEKFYAAFSPLFERERLVFSEAYLRGLPEWAARRERSILDSFKLPTHPMPKQRSKQKSTNKAAKRTQLQSMNQTPINAKVMLSSSIDNTDVTQEKENAVKEPQSEEKTVQKPREQLVVFGPNRPTAQDERKQRRIERQATQERALLWAEERYRLKAAGTDFTPKALKESEFDWMNDLNNPGKTIKFDDIEPHLKSLCGNGYQKHFGSSRVKVYIAVTPNGGPIACNFHPLHQSGHSVAIGIEHWRKTLLDMLHEAGYFKKPD